MNILSCEGKSEVILINHLIDRNLLIFTKRDILDHRPINFRQPKSVMPLINALPFDEELIFYRIGDTQTDEFDLSPLQDRKNKTKVIKICTTPEIEILIIINEGLYKEYLKEKSKYGPKQFVKIHLPLYSNFGDYIESHDIVPAIHEYKKLKGKQQEEMCLADLLKR